MTNQKNDLIQYMQIFVLICNIFLTLSLLLVVVVPLLLYCYNHLIFFLNVVFSSFYEETHHVGNKRGDEASLVF